MSGGFAAQPVWLNVHEIVQNEGVSSTLRQTLVRFGGAPSRGLRPAAPGSRGWEVPMVIRRVKIPQALLFAVFTVALAAPPGASAAPHPAGPRVESSPWAWLAGFFESWFVPGGLSDREGAPDTEAPSAGASGDPDGYFALPAGVSGDPDGGEAPPPTPPNRLLSPEVPPGDH